MLMCPDFGWDRVNFFLVAGIVLWFGFSMRRMLITHGCFQLLLNNVYTKSRIFSASDAQPVRRLEGHKKLGGDTASQDS